VTTLLALGFALQVRAADPWFGTDKVKHFFLSFFVQSVAYSTLRATNVGHESSLLGSGALAIGVGLGKEIVDRRRSGLFSPRDLAWDAAGVGAASLLLERTSR
jgi:putative lipoprotein